MELILSRIKKSNIISREIAKKCEYCLFSNHDDYDTGYHLFEYLYYDDILTKDDIVSIASTNFMGLIKKRTYDWDISSFFDEMAIYKLTQNCDFKTLKYLIEKYDLVIDRHGLNNCLLRGDIKAVKYIGKKFYLEPDVNYYINMCVCNNVKPCVDNFHFNKHDRDIINNYLNEKNI